MQTRILIPIAILSAFLSGCASKGPAAPSHHDMAYTARPPFADIAVNLGLKHDRDLLRLFDSLASTNVRCGMRAMSLNAEQIVVERRDFERAKVIVTEIIVRDRLTVRVYESAEFDKSPATSLLEVWEKGQKVREETYKLYFD